MPLKDPEARRKYQREYRLAHLEQYNKRDREYRETHAEQIYERNKRYVENNREKAREWTAKANRTWRKNHRSEFQQMIRDYLARHPERLKAKTAVYLATQSGKLIRPDHCEFCKRRCKPHAHHDDYEKPLEVVWLCSPCHKEADRKRFLREAQDQPKS
jgi:hypothetical protein